MADVAEDGTAEGGADSSAAATPAIAAPSRRRGRCGAEGGGGGEAGRLRLSGVRGGSAREGVPAAVAATVGADGDVTIGSAAATGAVARRAAAPPGKSTSMADGPADDKGGAVAHPAAIAPVASLCC